MSSNIPSETIIELVRRALNSPKGIEIPFSSPGQATHWRQRYYKVRTRVTKDNTNAEWLTLSAYIPPENPNVVQLIPTDAHIDMMQVREL
jgi:hypothetical protein